jgi:hypothetical protein
MIPKTLVQQHDLDTNGNPAGGATRSTGILIDWQNGPLGRGDERKEPNGAFVEGVIQAAIGRPFNFQTASNKKLACRETPSRSLKKLMWCEKRTRDREEREAE